jgi:hypothetical protein
MLPASESQGSWLAVWAAIPSFHWLGAEAVTDREPIYEMVRLSERGMADRSKILIKGQINPDLVEVILKVIRGANLGYFSVSHKIKF